MKIETQISINAFYKMQESDWIILRLLLGDSGPWTEDKELSCQYLENKYGTIVVCQCMDELFEEIA